ncbi:Translation initiation factor [Dirofilaria immitis]
MYEKISTKRIPPLSPILVNGFLKNPAAHSSILLKDSNSNIAEFLASSRCRDSINPVASKGPVTLESPEFIFIPPHSKQLLLSDESLTSSLQRSKVIPRNQNFLVSIPRASTNSPTSPEFLPLSQIDYQDLNENETFSNLDFVNSSLNFESDKSIMTQHSRSDNEIFQNHIICIDDSESVATTSEQSRDCFVDITIHEMEPSDLIFETKEANDLALETKVFVQSTSSLAGNQSKIDDFHNENDEAIYQKQYYRLSKLAETLKKRLFIGSSDLAMWKCEKLKQNPAKRVTVISSVEQWGFCWTLVKNVNDSRTAHIMDSEPMKKTIDVLSRNNSQKRRKTDDGRENDCCHDSSEQTSEKNFFFYRPLSKLNTCLGEFVLSPRYYR